jgi:hypothetical protein
LVEIKVKIRIGKTQYKFKGIFKFAKKDCGLRRWWRNRYRVIYRFISEFRVGFILNWNRKCMGKIIKWNWRFWWENRCIKCIGFIWLEIKWGVYKVKKWLGLNWGFCENNKRIIKRISLGFFGIF